MRVSVRDGALDGMIWTRDEVYFLEPRSRFFGDALPDETIIYRLSDTDSEWGPESCALHDPATLEEMEAPRSGSEEYEALFAELGGGAASYEEAELGIRLQKSGYKLRRLEVPFFHHVPHDMSSMQLLKYRWKNGFVCGSGELLRTGLKGGFFPEALRKVKNEAIFALYLLVLLAALLSGNGAVFGLAVLPLLAFFALKTVRNRSFRDGVQSVINLSVLAAGLIKGLFRPVRDPKRPNGRGSLS